MNLLDSLNHLDEKWLQAEFLVTSSEGGLIIGKRVNNLIAVNEDKSA